MNLIICTTPLQVLIAEKIIDMHKNERFFGIMIVSINNDKNNYYTERLRNKCHSFEEFLPEQQKGLKKIFFIWKFILGANICGFEKIFVSSIDNFIVQSLVSNIRSNFIYSFDDGTANICGKGYYYNQQIFSYRQRLVRLALNCRYDVWTLRKYAINSHYTIYPNLPNIVDNTKIVNLFFDAVNKNISEKEISILLGQPIFSDSNKNKRLVNKVLQKYKIDYYFPHPRENYVIDNIEYINTPLIFEDYFIKYLLNNRVKIFTFFSSVALNLMSAKNVEIVSIYDASIQKTDYIATYEVFRRMNIKVVDL